MIETATVFLLSAPTLLLATYLFKPAIATLMVVLLSIFVYCGIDHCVLYILFLVQSLTTYTAQKATIHRVTTMLATSRKCPISWS